MSKTMNQTTIHPSEIRRVANAAISATAVATTEHAARRMHQNAEVFAAAPDLLQALKEMVGTLENVAAHHPEELWLGSGYNDALQAIKKAEGRT